MEFNLLTLIVISVALMFFGYFFGLFEGRGQGAKKQKSEDELKMGSKSMFEQPLPPPSPPVDPAEKNLLALSLNPHDQPQLRLDGQLVDASRLTPENRKRLIDLMLVMRPWIENREAQKQASSLQPTLPVPPPAVIPPAPAVVRRAPPVPAAAAPAAPGAAPEPAPTSMVTQIDTILQARLAGTPLESLGIRLTESPRGDPIVVVGEKSYAGVGEVADPAIQAALRAAIAEWERIYTPGYK